LGKNLDFVAVTDADLDNDTYESALKQFEQNNNKQAISGFMAYSQFSKRIHSLQANFYLAQAYFSEGLEIIPNYEYVIGQTRSEFTEQSLARLSQVLLKTMIIQKRSPYYFV
jgi:tetratricopeptide (TPR) repeat protein